MAINNYANKFFLFQCKSNKKVFRCLMDEKKQFVATSWVSLLKCLQHNGIWLKHHKNSRENRHKKSTWPEPFLDVVPFRKKGYVYHCHITVPWFIKIVSPLMHNSFLWYGRYLMRKYVWSAVHILDLIYLLYIHIYVCMFIGNST